MITERQTRLTKLSRNELHNKLTKMKLSDARIAELKEWVDTRKKQLNKGRLDRVRDRRWRQVITPLTKHITTTRQNRKYHALVNPHLTPIIDSYIDELIQTRAKLHQERLNNPSAPTPKQKDWRSFVPQETQDRLQREWHKESQGNSKYSHTKALFPNPTTTKSKP
jgi:hypothetical protein